MKKEIPEEIKSLIVKHMYRELKKTEASELEKWIMKEKGNWGIFVNECNEINEQKNMIKYNFKSKIKM